MEIRFASSQGVPQFVVTAQTLEDKAMMALFLAHPHGKDMIFWLHGSGWTSSGIVSFNFGWIDRKSTVQGHQRTWYHRLWRWIKS